MSSAVDVRQTKGCSFDPGKITGVSEFREDGSQIAERSGQWVARNHLDQINAGNIRKRKVRW